VSISNNAHGYWVTPLLDRKAVRMQVDTGVAISFLYTRRNYITPQPTKRKLRTYTGEIVPMRGSVIVRVTMKPDSKLDLSHTP
jgi:hypothetical protein